MEREVLSSSPLITSSRTHGNGSKLYQKFTLDIQKHFFT